MISAVGLSATRDRAQVLRSVSLALEPGELVLLRGTRAATGLLLRMLGGIIHALQGSVHVDGRTTPATLPELRRSVAYASPTMVGEDLLRVDEFLQFVMTARSTPDRSARARDLVRRFHMDPRAPLPGLSRSERSVVALALALAAAAPVLAVDGALDQLDPQIRVEVIGALHEARGEGRAAIIATCDETLELEATRALELVDGRLVPCGDGVAV